MSKIHPPHDYPAARRAAGILSSHGFDAYIIGGAVRDLWLGRQPKDFDLVTNARPEQIIRIAEFRQSKYKDTAQAFGVTRVNFSHEGTEGELEIATFRKDLEAHRGRKATKIAYAELEDDVWRRDFTINALALDPLSGQVIDYVGGIGDLERKLIRFIGRPSERIQEDPLRIMRAIRFKNQLGFSYDPDTAQAIMTAAQDGQVEKVAVERLRDELTSLLMHPSRRQAVRDLYEFGILERLLPEVTAGKNVDQPRQFHAEGDVLQHELLILDCLPAGPSRRLAWAALLHDIGKPPTATPPRSADDRIRFNRHYAVGAEMAQTILKRFRFSTKDINDITWMIHNHLAIDDLPAMRPSRRRRMLDHPAFADLFELHQADAAASRRPGQPPHTPAFAEIERLWQEHLHKKPHERRPSLKRDLGIDGDWLLKNLGNAGLKPGPAVGAILESLEEWYQDKGDKDPKVYLKKARGMLQHLQSDKQRTGK